MNAPTILFLSVLSFLSGVAFASLGLSLTFSLVPAAVVFAALLGSNERYWIAILASVFLMAGAFYYTHDNNEYQAAIARMPASGTIRGLVSADPKQSSDTQILYLSTKFGALTVITSTSPSYAYGQELQLGGKITPPTASEFSRHIVGVMQQPSIHLLATGAGNPVFAALFGVKQSIARSFDSLLSPQESALLFGIMFGVNDHFSKQFANDLSISGLRFITAIDGLHMQIVIMILFVVLGSILPRRYAYIVAFICILFFVAMTGFTASGVRAALMASLARLATETRRVYLPHNALALAALVLTLLNPKALMFDVGFQLSFLAVIAIVYFLPMLRALLRLSDDPGVLGWKESFLITISVQLATAPLVISQFQTFSLTSFFASVLIVWMLPYVIAGGFLLAALAALPIQLFAVGLGFLMAPLLEYVMFVIALFARLAVSFNPPLGFTGVALYYAALLAAMYWYYREQPESETTSTKTAAQPVGAEAAAYEIIEIQ